MQKIQLINEQVHPNEYCRVLFKSNRYECDVQFYQNLLQQLSRLELWKHYDQITHTHRIVSNIKELTILHAKSLDQAIDEKQAKQLTEQIRRQLIKLDISPVKAAIDACNSMKQKPLSRLIYQRVNANQSHPQYKDVFTRIGLSIHNPRLRTDTCLLAGIFNLVNQQNADQLVSSYKRVIDRTMNEIKLFKPTVMQIQNEWWNQITQNPKFIFFVEGIKRMYELTMKLYQVIKIIQGQSSYKFKLNSLRSQLNNVLDTINSKGQRKYQLIEQEIHETRNKYVELFQSFFLDSPSSEIIQFIKQSLCFLCMRDKEIVSLGKRNGHIACYNFVKHMSR